MQGMMIICKRNVRKIREHDKNVRTCKFEKWKLCPQFAKFLCRKMEIIDRWCFFQVAFGTRIVHANTLKNAREITQNFARVQF